MCLMCYFYPIGTSEKGRSILKKKTVYQTLKSSLTIFEQSNVVGGDFYFVHQLSTNLKGEPIMEQMNVEKQMLGVKEVMAITGLGRAKTYELLSSGEFHVKKIGKKILVHKDVFERWLKGEKAQKKSRW